MSSDEDVSESRDDFEMDEAFEDDDVTTQASTLPGTSKGGRGRGKRQKEVKPPLASCCRCSKSFQTFDGYKTHIKSHILNDLFVSAPGWEAFEEEGRKVARGIVTPILNFANLYTAGLTKNVVLLLHELLTRSDDLFVFVDAVTIALWTRVPQPSSKIEDFHSGFLKSVNTLLCDGVERQLIVGILKNLVDKEFASEVLEWFVERFVRNLSSEIEAFYMRAMREPREVLLFGCVGAQKNINRDHAEDPDFQQSIYYIGGSVVRGVLNVARQSKKNSQWVTVDTFIRERVLVGELVEAPDESITEWTQSLDRGGLKYIGESMWTFLMGLTDLLKTVEEKDGRVRHEIVWSELQADSRLMFLWYEVVQSFLTENDSTFLLQQVCRRFVNTWGTGVALRHRNTITERVRDRIALRASLLGKK